MVETIERIADEHSSALAWHAAIIMKSLINFLVEVVIHRSTLRIDHAEQLVGLGTLTPAIIIHAVCIAQAHRLHLRCCPRSSRSRTRIVEALEDTRKMSRKSDRSVLPFTLQQTLCYIDILIQQ